jgi:Haem-binding uptake, Tiki superfamily, ChaN
MKRPSCYTTPRGLQASRAWPNYGDYRGLVDAAVATGVRVVASNAPRHDVALVAQRGPDALAAAPGAGTKGPPLPVAVASPALAEKLAREFAGADDPCTPAGSSSGDSPADAAAAACDSSTSGCVAPPAPPALSANFLAAQSLWDATMAHSIAAELVRDGAPAALARQGGAAAAAPLVMHVCGRFHIEGGLGIPEHLARYAPAARVATAVSVPVADVAAAVAAAAACGGAGAVGSSAATDTDSGSDGAALHASWRAVAALADFVVFTDAALPRTFEMLPREPAR